MTSGPITLKGRGRPATGQNRVTGIRLSEELRWAIDRWAANQEDKPLRSEAVRRLIELGLAGTRVVSQRNPEAASRASEMAAEQIDKLADSSTTEQERQTRKRRLLKGPREFRDIRADFTKPRR